MWRKFWTCAVALVFIICLASVVNAQHRPNTNRQGLSNANANGNSGNGNQGENPGNGNQGEDPGNGNQGENPGNGDQGENSGVNPGHGTPDGETPAEEDICDDLKYATPGLYGLCVAFCEAQDSECVPNWDAENPVDRYADCRMRDRRILERYERKMKDGDPVMPCLPSAGDQDQESACPCWGQDQLAYYPFYTQPYTVNQTYYSSGIDEDDSYWDEDDETGEVHLVCEQTTSLVNEASILSTGTMFVFDLYATTGDCDGTMCGGSFGCMGDGCPPELPEYGYFSMDLEPDEYDNCVASIQQLIGIY
jgi:hypothetical protein